MAKKKKTRKQKILSDLRQQANPLPIIDTSSGKILLQPTTPAVVPTAAASSFTYTHLKLDLLKTGFVTIGIIVLELLLHVLANGV